MKICFKCQNIKPLTDFYKHSQMLDGYLNKCKECNKKDVRENRKDKVNYYREYDRLRGNRITKEKIKERGLKYPAKKLALTLVNNLLRAGKISRQPCEECESTTHVHAHHDDYAKPFDVRWLCAAHHSQWHKKHGEAKNGSLKKEDLKIRSITQF